jgi:MFS family permease
MTHDPTTPRHDPYAVLRVRDFRLLIIGRLLSSLGGEMLTFAVAWQLWLRTHSALALGMVGLAQVVPVIVLSLPGGHFADQHNRRRIMIAGQSIFALCSVSLALLSWRQGPVLLIYAVLLVIGTVRAFNDPASSTLTPETVPPELFGNAATWTSSFWQLAAISGPAVAGVWVAAVGSVTWLYVFDAGAVVAYVVLLGLIRGRPIPLASKAATLDSLKEGFRFMSKSKVILAAITLDMFAVLFGGAVALLPIFATDILKVGPTGLGIMRAAPSVGALIMAFALAHLPAFKKAGKTLLGAVVGFGLATIVFGLSRHFLLSVAMLALLGALDNISVVIRATLMLTRVPDAMRGRISAVNSIFIGMSNELGTFESGLLASLVGPVIAVWGGGIGAILVALTVGGIFPQMRKLKTLAPEPPLAPRDDGAPGEAV